MEPFSAKLISSVIKERVLFKQVQGRNKGA